MCVATFYLLSSTTTLTQHLTSQKSLKTTISSNLVVSWHSRQVCKHHRDLHIAIKTDKDTITQVESAQQKLEGKVCTVYFNQVAAIYNVWICCYLAAMGGLGLCLDSAEILICSSQENSYDHNDKLSSYNITLKNLQWWNISEQPYIYHCNSRQKADRKGSDDNIRTEVWRKKWGGDRGGGSVERILRGSRTSANSAPLIQFTAQNTVHTHAYAQYWQWPCMLKFEDSDWCVWLVLHAQILAVTGLIKRYEC